jgi:hypothetical protein
LNKHKIINDPVYGFISIPSSLVFDVIAHPYFQRLRRINQMGLAHLVYPGATHTRFHHALGAMHLMQQALEVLKSKGHEITAQEEEGAILAILLHDIGHGPFSHTLEKTLVSAVHHEELSVLFQESLNATFKGALQMALDIFNDHYPKKFLHQLVSGQLDVDRMDYLNRDSFYTGVAEGVIGYDRIIKMLNVSNGQLVVEEKGIFSIEKFIMSRRLMYWQVYLHRTSVSADHMLISVLQRARDLVRNEGYQLICSPALAHFLEKEISFQDFRNEPLHLQMFALLDDIDVLQALKFWQNASDPVLSFLSKGILDRKLFKISFAEQSESALLLREAKEKFVSIHPEMKDLTSYLFFESSVANNAYVPGRDSIQILMKNGDVKDINEVAEVLTIKALSNPVVKHYICHPAI